MKKLFISVFLLFACTPLWSQVIMDFGPKYDLLWDYNPKDKSAIIWLSYGIGRFKYVTEHRGDYPKGGSDVLPSLFGDELKGRELALDTYVKFLKVGKCEKDDFWDEVRTVSDAGFMPEYVWTFYRRDDWPAKSAPKKLEEFARWRAEQIPNHKADTHGKIKFKKTG